MTGRTWKRTERRVAGLPGGCRAPAFARGRGHISNGHNHALSIEVKSRKTIPVGLEDALRQAKASAKDGRLAVAVPHRNGQKCRDALKTAVLLSGPLTWFKRLFRLYWDGTEKPVRLANPASGNVEIYLVSLSIKNIAAVVAESIDIGGFQGEQIRPEVVETLRAWKDGTA
jgi:hypothetical protein